jgi:hypothetical protein
VNGSEQEGKQAWYALASFGLTIAVLAAIFVAYIYRVPANDDVSVLLTIASRVWGGEVLYKDILEVNPPVSVWLYMPNMALEKLMGIRSENSLVFTMALLSLTLILFSGSILRIYANGFRKPAASLLVPFALFMTLCYAPLEFGQREEFAVIFLLPWLALFSARDGRGDFSAGDWTTRILAGLFGGFAMIVKPPYYALPLAVPIIAAVIRRRKIGIAFTTENLVAAAIVLLYLSYLVFINRNYIENVLPLTVNAYAKYYQIDYETISYATITMIISCFLLLYMRQNKKFTNPFPKNAFLSSVGFYLAFVVMGKGWIQHCIPFLILAVLAIVVEMTIGEQPADKNTSRFDSKTMIETGLLAIVGLPIFLISLMVVQGRTSDEKLKQVFANEENPTIATISPDLTSAFPLVRTVNGKFVSKYVTNWAAQYSDTLEKTASSEHDRKYFREIKSMVLDQYVDELSSKRPEYIVRKNQDPENNAILRDQRVQKIMSGYHEVYRKNNIILYRRDDLAAYR